MEQDVNIGSVGSADFKEGLAGETASAAVKVGPVKLSISAEIDNKDLLALVASKLPGGLTHDAAVALEKALFPAS